MPHDTNGCPHLVLFGLWREDPCEWEPVVLPCVVDQPESLHTSVILMLALLLPWLALDSGTHADRLPSATHPAAACLGMLNSTSASVGLTMTRVEGLGTGLSLRKMSMALFSAIAACSRCLTATCCTYARQLSGIMQHPRCSRRFTCSSVVWLSCRRCAQGVVLHNRSHDISLTETPHKLSIGNYCDQLDHNTQGSLLDLSPRMLCLTRMFFHPRRSAVPASCMRRLSY